MRDYVPGRVQEPAPAQAGVVRHIRKKLSCRACNSVAAAPAPDRAIAGRAGTRPLAHIVVAKYDHLLLYRKAEIFARDGGALETSTPAFARGGSCPAGSARRRRC
jgi:transposase